jgi:hypothetical protein
VYRKILNYISKDLEGQLIEKVRNKHLPIQIDETTDYTRYVKGTTINEGMLFCKPIKRGATAKELFKIVDNFMKKKT